MNNARLLKKAIVPVLARSGVVAAGAAILTIAAAAIELVAPLILRDIVDKHIEAGVAGGLSALAVSYLLTIVGSRLIGFGQSFLTSVLGQRILLRLRALIAEHLEKLPLRYYDRTPVGDIISRTTADVEAINTLFSTGVMNAVTDLFRIVGTLAAMFVVSPVLAWIAAATVPVVYATTEFFRQNIRSAQRRARVALGRVMARLQEILAGMQTVHVFGLERAMLESFDAPQREFLIASNYAAAYNAYFPGVLQTIQAVVLGLVLWVGSRAGLVAAGLSLGSLAAFTQLVGRLFSPVQSLSQEYQTIQQAMAGVERVAQLLGEPAEDRGARDAQSDAGNPSLPLEVAGLVFEHFPGQTVLDGLDFAVRPGEHVAIVGRTGAGKTTLLSLLSGLYAPVAGQVRVFGRDPRLLGPEERRRVLGIVPQTVLIMEGTVRDNITLGDATITDAQVERAMALSRATEVVARLPEGLDTCLGIGGARLSQGEAQMICLARALVYDPPLLIFDEPTSGMDVDTERLIFEALALNRGRRTVVGVSHRLTGVMGADRVIVLAKGRIVEDGPPERLATAGGWYTMFKQLEAAGWRGES